MEEQTEGLLILLSQSTLIQQSTFFFFFNLSCLQSQKTLKSREKFLEGSNSKFPQSHTQLRLISY